MSAARSLHSFSRAWEAIVVGAGPAGSLIARQLALCGRRVLLVDKKQFPRPKVCGACLNARAISILEAAGLKDLLSTLGGLPLTHAEILADGRMASVLLPQGVAVGRAEFDEALAAAAVRAGAEFCDGVTAKVGSLQDGDSREVTLASSSESARLTARVVIAADGLQHSCLSNVETFASEVAADSLIGLGATLPQGDYELPPGVVRMIAGPGGYVGIVGLSGGRLNVAAAVAADQLRRAAGPAELVHSMLERAGAASPAALVAVEWHGTGALTRETRRVADQRLFLLGDATGYVEPFTGEGISWALCSALRAAPLADACIAASGPTEQFARQWQVLHALEVRRRQAWCRRLAWVLRTPWRRRLALMAAATLPWLASRVARQMNERFVLQTT
jgi:flavin-dependent dehydrogenase